MDADGHSADIDQLVERTRRAPVHQVADKSPLQAAPLLGERLDRSVWLKREDAQPVHSFKLRGAFAAMHALTVEQTRHGVVAVSAGNHAQGVALAAARLGLAARIVMPVTTPAIKIQAVRRLGAEVILHGDGVDQAASFARQLCEQTGAWLVHPFDDPAVIAGQASIALELLEQWAEPPAVVFVPVGGGGLIAGVAAVLSRLAPATRVIGVEPEGAASLKAALAAGRPVDVGPVSLFADGVAVQRCGDWPFAYARQCVQEVITVSTDEVCAAVHDVFLETRSIVEPAGALAVAGLKRFVAAGGRGRDLLAICSGANVGFDRLAHVVERAEIGAGKERLLAATIPERPGSFLQFCQTLGRVTISEFNYRYGSPDQARVFVGLRPGEAGEPQAELLGRLRQSGYQVIDLTHDELAREHLRHVVGGHGPLSIPEQRYRFRFPERPGALLRFLQALRGRWSISLFHYRNHGADFGRVLCGFLVPPEQQAEFEAFIDETGYGCEPVTSPAADWFLGQGTMIDEGRRRHDERC